MKQNTAGRRRRRTDLAWCRGRRLVVIDLENVVGGPCTTADKARWAQRRLEPFVKPADHVIIGMDGCGLPWAGFEWPGARLEVGHGPNGADLRLLDVLAENVAQRYDEVVLVSGDGIFADAVAHLTGQGVRVTLVAHEVCLSARLRMSVSAVELLSHRTGPHVPEPRTA